MTKDYSHLAGQPAIDAPADLCKALGRPMKEVILVCPECGHTQLFLELPATDKRFGDAPDECLECGYGR